MKQTIIASLLFIALFLIVHFTIGWQAVLLPWQHIDSLNLILAIIAMLFSYLARTLRCYDFFGEQTHKQFKGCLKITLVHNAFNNLLPMRTGEASFPILLKRYFEIPLATSISALLWFRVMDMHALILTIILFLGYSWLPFPLYLLVLLLWLVLPIIIRAMKPMKWLVPFLEKKLPKHKEKIQQLVNGLPQSSFAFYKAWFWTLLNWIIKLGAMAWIFTLFLSGIPFVHAIIGAVGGDMTSILPIHSFAGAGTYEAGIIAVLLPFGYNAKEIFPAAIDLHFFILGLSLLTGFLALLIPNQFILKRKQSHEDS